MSEPLTLRALVQQAFDARGGSGRSLAAAAERAGHKITHTTVNHIAAGTYRSRPSADTVRAIAWLASVPEEQAFAAAGLQAPGPPFKDELPPDTDYLSPKSRKAAIEMLRRLIELESRAATTSRDVVDPPADGDDRVTLTDDVEVDPADHVLAARDADDDDEAEAQQGDA